MNASSRRYESETVPGPCHGESSQYAWMRIAWDGSSASFEMPLPVFVAPALQPESSCESDVSHPALSPCSVESSMRKCVAVGESVMRLEPSAGGPPEAHDVWSAMSPPVSIEFTMRTWSCVMYMPPSSA